MVCGRCRRAKTSANSRLRHKIYCHRLAGIENETFSVSQSGPFLRNHPEPKLFISSPPQWYEWQNITATDFVLGGIQMSFLGSKKGKYKEFSSFLLLKESELTEANLYTYLKGPQATMIWKHKSHAPTWYTYRRDYGGQHLEAFFLSL